MVVWGFFAGQGLRSGFWGWGFQLMGLRLGPVVCGLLGALGWGSLYKHKK